MGGPVGYGLQRLALGAKSRPKGILADGERKYLSTDHVRVRPGTADERAVVKWIFQEFLRGKSQSDIWRALNLRGVPSKSGRLWNHTAISAILRNETYIGSLVHSRVAQKLGAKKTRNPRDLWIRSEGCVEPIIDRDVFFRARKRLEEYRVVVPEDEMLVRLRKVLMKKGSLSAAIIDSAPSLLCTSTYLKHFGTLRNLYRLIGYNNAKYWDDREAYQRWADLNRANGTLLREAFEKTGARASFDPSLECLRVNDAVNICFGLAKCRKYEGRPVQWTMRHRVRQPMGWTVAIRLGENNEAILDYILLPSFTRPWLWFSEEHRPAHKIE